MKYPGQITMKSMGINIAPVLSHAASLLIRGHIRFQSPIFDGSSA
jgi:hypothetical protein